MKLIITVLFIVTSLSLSAQKVDFEFNKTTVPISEGKIIYTQVDTLANVKKEQIYNALLTWVALNFKSAKSVIQLKDLDAGKIILRGNYRDSFNYRILGSDNGYPYDLEFTLDITIKDNKYKTTYSDFAVQIVGGQGWPLLELYNRVPDTYDFSKLGSSKRNEMYRAKQILKHTNEFVEANNESMKSKILTDVSSTF